MYIVHVLNQGQLWKIRLSMTQCTYSTLSEELLGHCYLDYSTVYCTVCSTLYSCTRSAIRQYSITSKEAVFNHSFLFAFSNPWAWTNQPNSLLYCTIKLHSMHAVYSNTKLGWIVPVSCFSITHSPWVSLIMMNYSLYTVSKLEVSLSSPWLELRALFTLFTLI